MSVSRERLLKQIAECKEAEERLKHQQKLLEITYETTKIASTSLDMADLSQRLVQYLGERFDLTTVTLLVSNQRDELVVLAGYGYPPGLLERITPIKGDSDHEAPRVFRSGKTKLVEDIDAVSLPKGAKEVIREIEASTGTPTKSYMIIPLKPYQKTIGIISFSWPEARRFSDEDVAFFSGISHEIAVGLENARLYAEEREYRSLADTLGEINAKLTSSLDPTESMPAVLESAASALRCDAVGILLRENEQFVLAYLHGLPGNLIGTTIDREQLPHMLRAADTRKPTIIRDAAREGINAGLVERFHLKTAMALPLVAKKTLLGVIGFNYSEATELSEARIDFAKKMAASVSMSLENSRLYRESRQVGETLQDALLQMPETLRGLEFGHSYASAPYELGRVGGDFYDLFELERGRVGIVIGDVSGKGLAAATLTSLVKTTIMVLAHQKFTPANVMYYTNDLLRKVGTDQFVSVWFGIYNTRSRVLLYCSAGHPPPLVREGDGTVSFLATEQPVLGIMWKPRMYEDQGTHLRPAETLVLYTDGVTEARRGKEFFGEERLSKLVGSHATVSARELPGLIVEQVRQFAGGRIADDVAVLALSPREAASSKRR